MQSRKGACGPGLEFSRPHTHVEVRVWRCARGACSSKCKGRGHACGHVGTDVTATASPAMADEATRRLLSGIPLLRMNAGPRDGERWRQRLKEEYQALIQYVESNKLTDNDWFRLESNKDGTRWSGKCWYVHELLKYEFDIEFEIPVTYPATAPEIAVPELDGKTVKMYRGGKICLTEHFKPLWARNVPKFGLGHLMALGLGPWLAVEVPDLIAKGLVQHRTGAEQG